MRVPLWVIQILGGGLVGTGLAELNVLLIVLGVITLLSSDRIVELLAPKT